MAKLDDHKLRERLTSLLAGRQAHADFEAAVEGLAPELRGKRPQSLPHSPWELLEHLRIAQWDILEFSRNPQHKSPAWPSGYWPKSPEPPNASAWDESVQNFRNDHKALVDLLRNPDTDLQAHFPWGDGQDLLREALLVADHNAYHIGQLILVRRLLGAWK